MRVLLFLSGQGRQLKTLCEDMLMSVPTWTTGDVPEKSFSYFCFDEVARGIHANFIEMFTTIEDTRPCIIQDVVDVVSFCVAGQRTYPGRFCYQKGLCKLDMREPPKEFLRHGGSEECLCMMARSLVAKQKPFPRRATTRVARFHH